MNQFPKVQKCQVNEFPFFVKVPALKRICLVRWTTVHYLAIGVTDV